MAARDAEKYSGDQNIEESGQNSDDWTSGEACLSDEELLRAESLAFRPQTEKQFSGTETNGLETAVGSAPTCEIPPKSKESCHKSDPRSCSHYSSEKCHPQQRDSHCCRTISGSSEKLGHESCSSCKDASPATPLFSESLTDEDLLEAALTPPSLGIGDNATSTTVAKSKDMTNSSNPTLDSTSSSDNDCSHAAAGLSTEVNESSSKTKDDKSPITKKRRTTPLFLYRYGYLCVTDICSQSWCEQQMVYTYAPPAAIEVVESTEMKKGATMHRERELEVHEIVPIKVSSAEDAWAVKLLNMIAQVTWLQRGKSCVREIHVFGEPYDMGVFIVGVIDELRYSDKGEFELLDFKTRGTKSMPSKPQQRKERLQVSLYKRLFDDMVQGKLEKENILKHLGRSADRPLGEEVMEYGRNVGIACATFGELLDRVLLVMAHSDVPCIDSLKIEYRYQDDSDSFLTKSVDYDDKTLRKELGHYFDFWKGDREVEGVPIEDAWKCGKCPYADFCEWRKKKAAEIKPQFRHKRP